MCFEVIWQKYDKNMYIFCKGLYCNYFYHLMGVLVVLELGRGLFKSHPLLLTRVISDHLSLFRTSKQSGPSWFCVPLQVSSKQSGERGGVWFIRGIIHWQGAVHEGMSPDIVVAPLWEKQLLIQTYYTLFYPINVYSVFSISVKRLFMEAVEAHLCHKYVYNKYLSRSYHIWLPKSKLWAVWDGEIDIFIANNLNWISKNKSQQAINTLIPEV